MDAVSYTHLDVYKRQEYPGAVAVLRQQGEHVIGAVSYTHLDVYKRQA